MVSNNTKTNILTFLSLAGLVVTAGLTAKSTVKAAKRIESEREERGDLDKYDIVKLGWKYYIPPVLTGVATAVCIVGTNKINHDHQKSLIGAYTLVSQSYKSYKNKVIERFGEETHQDIVNSIIIEQPKEVHISSSSFFTNNSLEFDGYSGETLLFYDMNSKRYFESSPEKVLEAEYHLNRNYTISGEANLNCFYDFLGLNPIDGGECIGWSAFDGDIYWIDFDHRKAVLEDGLECFIIDTPYPPMPLNENE